MQAAHGGNLDINELFRSGGRAVEFLDQINQATIVMLASAGIVPQPYAGRIAQGIALLIAQAATEAPRRSADYLDYEPRLTALIGADASRLHSGRSRQDLASAIARMNLRDGLFQEVSALVDVRERIIDLAEQHIETIIPAYTHGVQAQPTTLAHYLHALAAALGRQTERLQQVYARINRNPLGSAALATSSFPIDRHYITQLLGFDGLQENAYDANHLASVDSALEVAGVLAIAAVQIGQFAQDLHAQYAEPVPWILLTSGALTGVSSIMPQKRNPAALEQLRAQSSIMLGELQTVFLISHNNRTGMFDYRMYDPVPCGRALQVFKLLGQVITGLVVNKERARAEVDADYSTTTEIADALAQRADVPFRTGHHFASQLTDYGRSHQLRLQDIPFSEVIRIYQAEAGQDLPLTEVEFRHISSAEYMVYGRRGIGGPQPQEVQRMLAAEREAVTGERAWLVARKAQLDQAAAQLAIAFKALVVSA